MQLAENFIKQDPPERRAMIKRSTNLEALNQSVNAVVDHYKKLLINVEKQLQRLRERRQAFLDLQRLPAPHSLNLDHAVDMTKSALSIKIREKSSWGMRLQEAVTAQKEISQDNYRRQLQETTAPEPFLTTPMLTPSQIQQVASVQQVNSQVPQMQGVSQPSSNTVPSIVPQQRASGRLRKGYGYGEELPAAPAPHNWHLPPPPPVLNLPVNDDDDDDNNDDDNDDDDFGDGLFAEPADDGHDILFLPQSRGKGKKNKAEIQAILFRHDGKLNKVADQKKWLKQHKLRLLKGKKIHLTDNYSRYRITEPHPKKKKRVQRLNKDIDAIIQY
jgi:hypothetical protein